MNGICYVFHSLLIKIDPEGTVIRLVTTAFKCSKNRIQIFLELRIFGVPNSYKATKLFSSHSLPILTKNNTW